jgi:predicted dehydrogenase
MSEVRVAIVGCGAIADWHVTAIGAAAPRTRITACVDPDLERAQAFAARTGGVACSSLAEAVAVGIDAAAVMVPHHLHEPLAMEAFAAGLHVLLEKPMATTPAACERILATAPADRVFMLAENAQYWPEVLLAQQLLRDGAIGELITARAWHCFPPMGDFYAGETPWRMSLAAAGGGIAMDAGSHWLRPLRMWCGELVDVVAATARPFPGMEGESMCRALCRFDTGVIASFDALLVPGAVSDLPLFQLTGTTGEITIEGLGRVRHFDGSDYRGTVVGQGNYLQSYEGEWADFEAAVLDGSPLAADARHALGEIYGALAMYRSAESGKWETVWE